MRRAAGLGGAALAAVAAALLAGCGGEGATPGAAAAPVAQKGTVVKVVRSQFGAILADGRGQALYRFSREASAASRCYGACAKSWPPMLAKGRPSAGKRARANLVGTTVRRDGTQQVTYAGRPVYFYVRDTPGKVLCQDVSEFGGTWRVIRSDGTPVR
jgi:predicted lipoprotein with Yx(FWY)xxD motif